MICGSCASPLMKLPVGPGTAAVDASDALSEATRACRDISTIKAEISVTGSVGGRGLRARLLAGLAAPSSARLEALAPFGQPVFVLVARDNETTLLLPRDRRVLEHGRADEALDAVAGVPIDAKDLRIALTGCTAAPRAQEARQLGDDWRIVPDASGDVYLHRDARGAPWRIVAAQHSGAGGQSWRAEYRDFQQGSPADGLPKTVRLTSLDAKRFDLRLAISQVELNVPLGVEVFTVQIPQGTQPISIEELRQSGPLANPSSGK
jgi:hypothetical protein